MLLSATVPNTYAAGRASLATWRHTEAKEAPPQELDDSHPLCECGRRRRKGSYSAYSACDQCRALDCRREAEQNVEAIDRGVIRVFGLGERLTVTAVYERLVYRWPRHVIGRSLKRLLVASKLIRGRADSYSDGYAYMLAD